MKRELVVIGGGPAGLAAAIAAKEAGVDDLLILERDKGLGGILNQCIHNGFGLHTFKEELTGPEYAARYIEQACGLGIEYRLNTMVVDLAGMENGQKAVTAMNRDEGLYTIEAEAVILAMGCRERPRGALNIPGFRPAGIYTAGTAQRFVNMEGRMPGREVVILGSGDIGLIMARRLTLEGAKVKLVAELMPYSGGLQRNIVQCLDDFGIPLKLSHTVVDIKGSRRVEAVVIARVDEAGRPVPGTEEEIACDTLLLSCGLIPENELSVKLGAAMDPQTNGPLADANLMTSCKGVFACGNVLHVHDLVDRVSQEAQKAGRNAAGYLRGSLCEAGAPGPVPSGNAKHRNVPKASTENRRELVCIGCPLGCSITVELVEGEIRSIAGNTCPRGADYAARELTAPRRIVTSLVKVEGGELAVAPVKTAGDIPKDRIADCIRALKDVTLQAPVRVGDVVLPDVCGSGIAVVASGPVEKKR